MLKPNSALEIYYLMWICLYLFHYQLCTIGLFVTSIHKRTTNILKTLSRVEQSSQTKIVYTFSQIVVSSLKQLIDSMRWDKKRVYQYLQRLFQVQNTSQRVRLVPVCLSYYYIIFSILLLLSPSLINLPLYYNTMSQHNIN